MKNRGFTLIELMIVVAVIGILATVALPKFADLMSKSKEARVKNELGSLRAALNIYYGDNEAGPQDLLVGLTTGEKYISKIPAIEIPPTNSSSNPGHASSSGIVDVADDFAGGAWIYDPAAGNGLVAVNCSHADTKNSIWENY